jgi:hypothetical protein
MTKNTGRIYLDGIDTGIPTYNTNQDKTSRDAEYDKFMTTAMGEIYKNGKPTGQKTTSGTVANQQQQLTALNIQSKQIENAYLENDLKNEAKTTAQNLAKGAIDIKTANLQYKNILSGKHADGSPYYKPTANGTDAPKSMSYNDAMDYIEKNYITKGSIRTPVGTQDTRTPNNERIRSWLAEQVGKGASKSVIDQIAKYYKIN